MKIIILEANLSLSKDPLTKYAKALFPERKNKTPLDNDCNSYVKQELQCKREFQLHPVFLLIQCKRGFQLQGTKLRTSMQKICIQPKQEKEIIYYLKTFDILPEKGRHFTSSHITKNQIFTYWQQSNFALNEERNPILDNS